MKSALIAALFALLPLSAMADEKGMSFEETLTDWRAANWTCESGKDHDGGDVDLQTIKSACVSMGVLTAKLAQAGYCFDAKNVEWASCAPAN